MEQPINLANILGAMRRRLVMIAVITVIGVIVSTTIALVLPPVYRATATVLVESQQIPDQLARSTVTSDAAERLRVIEQRLMTRENLLDVAIRLELFRGQPNLTPTERVDLMRASTFIEPIALSEGARRRARDVRVAAFNITYEADAATVSARVANEFVSMVIEQNLRTRGERATETLGFFKAEAERLQRELLELETRITEFKIEFSGALPDSLDFRRNELESLRTQLFELEQRRIEFDENKKALERALASGDNLGGDQRDLTPEERDLEALRRELAQKRGIYSREHPEIRALTARVRALERSVRAAGGGGSEGEEAGNPRVRRNLELIDTQLQALIEQRDKLQARREELEGSIEQTPQVEMALSALSRRYDDLKAQYQSTVLKQAEAETGEKLEVNRQAERFEVIEQAQPPDEPVAPKRKLIAAGGGAASLILAFGVALLLEMSSTVIHTRADLARHLELRPIVTVPYIYTQDESRGRSRKLAIAGVAAVAALAATLIAVDQLYLPLSAILDKIFSRVG